MICRIVESATYLYFDLFIECQQLQIQENSYIVQMIKALTQIVMVDIGSNVVSMSIVEKQNQSGFKFNQRLLVLVHSHFFGYISKVKMSDQPTSVVITDVKVQVPIKKLFSVYAEDDLLKIKFYHTEETQTVQKQWNFKLATPKLASLWVQYFQHEIKSRKKNGTVPKKSSRPDLNSNITKKASIQQEDNIKNQKQKNPATLSKPQLKPQKREESKSVDKNKVIVENTIGKDKSPKVFQNPLFEEGDDQDEEAPKKSKRSSRIVREASLKSQDIASPEKKNKNSSKGTEEIKLGTSSNNQNSGENKQAQVRKQKVMQIKKIEEPESQNTSKIQKKIETKFQLTKIQEHQHQDTPRARQNKFQAPKQQNHVKFPALTNQKTSNNQRQIVVQKQIGFMQQIVARLDQKHSKTPINQIVYDHQELQKIIKIYGPKLGQGTKNKNTENVLNNILEAQKFKLSKEKKLNPIISQNTSWVFQQFTIEQTQTLLKFQSHCKNLMKELYLQLSVKIFVKFQKYREQKDLLYFKYEDLDIKIPLIVLQEAKNSANVKIINKSSLKSIQHQFKGYQYLYRIIANQGRVRVPLCCLCQYGGLIGFFKVRPTFFQKERNQTSNEQKFSGLENLSNLPLSASLKDKLKPLNQFFYNQMRQQSTSHISFKYYFIDDINRIFIYDLNDNTQSQSQNNQLRIELIERQDKVLPFVARQQLESQPEKREMIQNLCHKIYDQVQALAVSLNNLDFVFINPKELSQKMHSHGINMRYLSLLYKKITNSFVSSLILSQMTARVVKSLFMKSFQDQCLQHTNKYQSSSQLQKNLLQKTVDFMNCFFGDSNQSDAMWILIKNNIQEYLKIKIDSKQQLNKGQLLVSVFYHCNLSLKWDWISNSQVFIRPDNFNNLILYHKQVKVKNFSPQNNILQKELSQKLKQINSDNFEWITNKLQLRSQKLSKQVRLFGLQQELKIYLSNFIEAQQLDWSNNYSHLGIYQTSQPSANSYKLDIALLKWSLKTDCKFKYLNRFNQFTSKVIKLYGNNHPLLCDLYELFANHHKTKGQVEDCISFIKLSILNFSALGADYSPKMAQKYYDLAIILLDNNRSEQAKEYLIKAKGILKHSKYKNPKIEAKIKLNFSLMLFNDEKYEKILQQLQNVQEYLQVFQKDNNQAYESQRLQLYQLLYISYDKLGKNTQNIKLCTKLYDKLRYFKSYYNFQQILWMIIESNIKNIDKQNQKAIHFFWNSFATKQSINYYKKSYQLLLKRYKQSSLIETTKKYFQNSAKIVERVKEKGLLQDWQNLKTIYERQSIFDFVSFMEQILYMMGRDRLNTIQLK